MSLELPQLGAGKPSTDRLDLNYERTLGWGFVQVVLSAIWEVEDGFEVYETNSAAARKHHPSNARLSSSPRSFG